MKVRKNIDSTIWESQFIDFMTLKDDIGVQ